MSQRPSLKLKLTSQPSTPTPVDTPSTGGPKLKLKFGSGAKATSLEQPATTPPPAPPKTKAVRKTKNEKPARTSTPTAKKRDLAASTLSDDDNEITKSAPPAKIPKITLKTRPPSTSKPFIRVKTRGEKPFRPLGVGYDSEASDREDDPAIEEDFVLRMQPGDDCEYLRQAIAEKRWGPKSEGGADIKMRFLKQDGRRAIITIRGKVYAASMVDLPCIVEGMKSWDRRGWWKSVDICQMLLVLGPVNDEEQALTHPLPREVNEKTWQYAHGLTPPMRWARKQRFRKRVSNRTIEAVEEQVERLCQLDEECEGESKYEILDLDRMTRELSARESEDQMEDYEQDADGDLDDDMHNFFSGPAEHPDQENLVDDGLEADLERAFADEENPSATPSPPAPTPLNTSTPTAPPTPSVDDTSSVASDDDDDDDDDDPGAASEVDEDDLEQQQDLQRQKEEMEDLEAAIQGQEAELVKLQNPILRQKLGRKIQSLRGDLELKRGAVGEGEEEE